MTTRYRVEIINPPDGRPKLWDVYPSRSRAEDQAPRLRAHKFWVQVRRIEVDDDPPEPDLPAAA